MADFWRPNVSRKHRPVVLTDEAYEAHITGKRMSASEEKVGNAVHTVEPDSDMLRFRKVQLTSHIPSARFAELTLDNSKLILVTWQPTSGMSGYAVLERGIEALLRKLDQ